MRTWFLCKVKYAKENEEGLLKNVSEQYLVDAVSFTEAEARIYDMLGSVIRGDFQVTSISKSNIVDVFSLMMWMYGTNVRLLILWLMLTVAKRKK